MFSECQSNAVWLVLLLFKYKLLEDDVELPSLLSKFKFA